MPLNSRSHISFNVHSARNFGLMVALFVLFTPFQLRAQYPNEAHAPFDLFFRFQEYYNPALNGYAAGREVSLGYHNQVGLFSAIRTYYARVNWSLSHDSSAVRTRQCVGLYFIGNQEGEFINRNRLAGSYAFHLRVSRRSWISAGATGSLISYAYQSSTASGGGSDAAWTVNAGLAMHSANYFIGLSISDLNNPEVNPIAVPTLLHRYVNVTAGKKFVLSADWHTWQYALTQFLWNNQLTFQYASIFTYRRYSVGLSYKHQSGAGIMLGIEGLMIGQNEFKAIASYKLPLSNLSRLDLNTFEMSAALKFR
jgi:type IX secretion system PorP/SprF family membrane protein